MTYELPKPRAYGMREEVSEKELFRRMLLIRLAEMRLEAFFHLDQRHHPIQLCIGQEAITVGVCSVLGSHDALSSRYRSHGHYLARGGDLSGLVSELRHRNDRLEPGCASSLEIVDEAIKRHESAAIFHGGLRLATGIALAQQMKSIFNPTETAVSVVFFGMPMLEEGQLYESLHFAAKHKLPLIYVFENNAASQKKARLSRNVVRAMASSVSDPLCRLSADGNNVLSVQRAATEALKRARAGGGPTLIECGPEAHPNRASVERHVRNSSGTRCPIDTLRKKLLASAKITPGEIRRMERALQEEIDHALRREQARGANLPPHRPPNFIFV